MNYNHVFALSCFGMFDTLGPGFDLFEPVKTNLWDKKKWGKCRGKKRGTTACQASSPRYRKTRHGCLKKVCSK